ncbi:MAG: tetratricopeptide repeat protein [Oscillatoriaceae bacterium SKW80]|nr:tetratricopeptide repeat protein [Oscillatoriaceae bacterium SKW80]
MSEKSGRWIIRVVMVIALTTFVGFSLLPLLNNVIKANQMPSEATSTPSQGAQSSQQPDLEAQARGYELVLQREPDNQAALKGLLEVRLQALAQKKGDVQDVIPPLEKLVKLNPEEPRYGVLLAQAKQYIGEREGAAQIYRQILISKPGNIEALQGLASLLIQQNRPTAAIGLLQDTIKTANTVNQAAPGSIDVPAVQLILGDVYAQQKRYDEALAVFDEIIKNNKDDFRPVLAKALVLKMQGKTEDARAIFAKAINLAPAQYKDQIQQLAAGAPTPAPSPANIPSLTEEPANMTPAPAPATSSPLPKSVN